MVNLRTTSSRLRNRRKRISVQAKHAVVDVIADNCSEQTSHTSHVLKPIGARTLSKFKIKTPVKYWGRYITASRLILLYGWRGSGKSTFLMALALAMSSGVGFLGHRPARPTKVVLLDGEMDLYSLKSRLISVSRSVGVELSDDFKIISPELFSGIMPRINTPEGQEAIEYAIGLDWEVLIIDNYSAFSSGRENAEAWAPWLPWLLKLKRAGKTVIVVHHTGKNGTQRGASNHEDAMDYVMSLRPPKFPPLDGSLEFVVSWPKSRHLASKYVQPIQVAYREIEANRYQWVKSLIVDANPEHLLAFQLKEEGLSITEIARKLGKDKSSISRWLNN